MKKMILATALILSIQPAFASQAQDLSNGDAVAGAIIGGVIGGVIGGAIGSSNGRDHGHGHGGHYPRPMPRPMPYPNDDQVVCYARNARGQVFRAFGWGERRTQFRAMDRCESVSRFCQPLGCQY